MAATFTLEEDLQNEAFKVRELELQVRDLQREIADYKINADPDFKKEVMSHMMRQSNLINTYIATIAAMRKEIDDQKNQIFQLEYLLEPLNAK